MQFQSALKIIAASLLTLGLSACGGSGGDQATSPPNPFDTGVDWSPNQVQLNCEDSKQCPNAVGVLFTLKKKFSGNEVTGYTIFRCTASLYENNKLITAGHCVTNMKPDTQTFFRTVSKPGQPSQTYKVANILNSKFSEAAAFGTDYASVQLEASAQGIDFVRSPQRAVQDIEEMTAMVVNGVSQENLTNFTLDAQNCAADTKYAIPLKRSTLPEVFGVKSCRLIGGNSGGPIFAKGDLSEVLGVLSKSTESGDAPRYMNRAIFANAYCFSLPGWRPAEVGCTEITEESLLKGTLERILEDEYSPLTQYQREREHYPVQISGSGAWVRVSQEVTSVMPRWGKGLYATFIPRPLCVEMGDFATEDRLPIQSKLFTLAPGNEGIRAEPASSVLEGEIRISKTENGKYSYKYWLSSHKGEISGGADIPKCGLL